jgi:hypothetical protein
VVAELREGLSVSKRARRKLGMERFNLNNVECEEEYQVRILRFAALENLDHNVDINRTGESIKENIKTSAKER